MARIVYGLSGEGMGHAIRSVPVIRHLKKNHDVLIVTYGRAYYALKRHFDEVLKVEGLHIKYRKTRLRALIRR